MIIPNSQKSIMPNLLIIGAAKSGTTALYHYLKQHPQIYMSPVKETEFFALEGNDSISAHKKPPHLHICLDDIATENLRKWYARDYIFL